MADANFNLVGVTNGGKELGYRNSPNSGLYEICFNSGGEIHKSMEGKFVSPRDARIAIKYYLSNHQKPIEAKQKAKSKTKKVA